jgi:hypothetical protein
MRTIPNRAKRRDKDNKEYIFKRSLFVRGDLCCMRLRCDLNPRLVGWLVFTRTICSQYVLIYFYLIYFVKFIDNVQNLCYLEYTLTKNTLWRTK